MKSNSIVVLGVGRVGLPLALVFADVGFGVVGIDIDPFLIALLEKKTMPFLEEGAGKLLKKYGGNKFRIFSSEHQNRVISESKFIVITLGTPIDETYSPDHKQIEELIISMSPYLKKGHVIILRSTISPGTTEQIARIVEEQSKLKVGKEIFLAYCPERIAEGKSVQELREIPQITGTLDEESAKEASKLFSKIAPSILYSDPKAAELAKLYSNMYRYIDFAIGNEFMMIAEDYGTDIYKVLELVNKDYKRAGLKAPGFTAGPCLVKDGFFLLDKSPFMELVTASWRLNENVPGYILKRIKGVYPNLNKKKVAILGLAFKKDSDDARFSLTPKLERYFLAEGAIVSVSDPFISTESMKSALKDAQILVMGINHTKYKSLKLKEIQKLVSKDCLVADIWNIFGTGKIMFNLKDYLSRDKRTK